MLTKLTSLSIDKSKCRFLLIIILLTMDTVGGQALLGIWIEPLKRLKRMKVRGLHIDNCFFRSLACLPELKSVFLTCVHVHDPSQLLGDLHLVTSLQKLYITTHPLFADSTLDSIVEGEPCGVQYLKY